MQIFAFISTTPDGTLGSHFLYSNSSFTLFQHHNRRKWTATGTVVVFYVQSFSYRVFFSGTLPSIAVYVVLRGKTSPTTVSDGLAIIGV